jgi:hypothetical protein
MKKLNNLSTPLYAAFIFSVCIGLFWGAYGITYWVSPDKTSSTLNSEVDNLKESVKGIFD